MRRDGGIQGLLPGDMVRKGFLFSIRETRDKCRQKLTLPIPVKPPVMAATLPTNSWGRVILGVCMIQEQDSCYMNANSIVADNTNTPSTLEIII